ncbi:MAG: MotA/TolQ/ExbB proton channel family protein [Epsilonproteobacteria bacterium]|nr:MotA/TolQ/ExbB proton channel family protein [Campylobacterota bacterium]
MNLMDYIDQGGVIMYILIVLNIIGFTTMIIKLIQFLWAKSKIKKSVDGVYESFSVNEKEAQLALGKDMVAEKLVRCEKGLSTIRIIASVAPLLGLLGTVIGVLTAFEAISKQGLSDPSIFAGGISLALVTTVGGLIVAIPHYIGYNYLIGMLDKLEAQFNTQLSLKIYEERS